jgi:hypothetical protein
MFERCGLFRITEILVVPILCKYLLYTPICIQVMFPCYLSKEVILMQLKFMIHEKHLMQLNYS